MATGKTPLLDSLITNGNCVFRADYRIGSFIERQTSIVGINNSLSYPVLLQRNVIFPASTNANCRLDYGAFAAIGTGNLTIIMRCNIRGHVVGGENFGNGKLRFYYNTSASRFDFTSNNATIVNSGDGSARPARQWNTCAVVRKSDGKATFYVNGVRKGAVDQNSGTPEAGTTNLFVGTAFPGDYAYIYVFNIANLSDAEIATLTDELDNQIIYETNPLVLNSSYPHVGSSVLEARFGILADECTMSAGQSLGQLDALRVVSGTHKCSTELYGTKLAKTIVCVTNGTVRLPDPRPELGTTFAFKKYTGGAWTDATSGSTDIALTAGEKILWATQDASVCLRKY